MDQLKKIRTLFPEMIVILGIIVIIFSFTKKLNGQFYNQQAFVPAMSKQIYFSEEEAGKEFVVEKPNGEVLLKGKTSEARFWEYAGMSVCEADLSPLTQNGIYFFKMGEKDILFRIDSDSYNDIGRSMLKSFYHARMSEEILEKHAGAYARKAGHPDNKVMIHASAASEKRPEGFIISSPGGWYDAGDYNKYIVNSSISVYNLLHLYELFPTYLDDLNVNIPESQNGVSDLLDEALFNLKWMLTMQDPEDGGVYHKLTSRKFCGMIKPSEDQSDRYLMMKSTAATLDLAALSAKAYRIFSEFEVEFPGLSSQLLEVSQKAFKWAIKHPDVIYVQPEDVKTGQYKDQDLKDEWFWASIELFLSTGDDKYLEYAQKEDQQFRVPEWRRVNMLGLYSLLSYDGDLDLSTYTFEEKGILFEMANRMLNRAESSAFGVPIVKFPWGSNSEVANDGILLMQAFKYSKNVKFLTYASNCGNYLLGANPLAKCFITGFGLNAPKNLHDRRCESDGIAAPIPGLLAGGPTNAVQSDCGEDKYPSKLPALSYIDEVCSYSTNEIAINWNSAGVSFFLGLDAIMHELKYGENEK